MKSNIFCKNENGQTLIESLITYVLLFLCAFFVIEIARLVAFKNCLQAATSYITHEISYAQIDLLQKNIITNQKGVFNNNKIISDKIKKEIEFYLNNISTTLFSFDNKGGNSYSKNLLYLSKHYVNINVKFINNSIKDSSGVYIESRACLPVLFSSYFRHMKGDSEVGKTVKDDSRTCLGYFNTGSLLPLFWFRVRVSAFSPWPASTQIFYSGLAQPEQFVSLAQEKRKEVISAINSLKFKEFFLPLSDSKAKVVGWSNE